MMVRYDSGGSECCVTLPWADSGQVLVKNGVCVCAGGSMPVLVHCTQTCDYGLRGRFTVPGHSHLSSRTLSHLFLLDTLTCPSRTDTLSPVPPRHSLTCPSWTVSPVPPIHSHLSLPGILTCPFRTFSPVFPDTLSPLPPGTLSPVPPGHSLTFPSCATLTCSGDTFHAPLHSA